MTATTKSRGPESPDTIHHASVRAHNHAVVLKINDRYHGLSILTNTGRSEDVAILGVDNDRLICSLSDPPLSSISLRRREETWYVGEIRSIER